MSLIIATLILTLSLVLFSALFIALMTRIHVEKYCNKYFSGSQAKPLLKEQKDNDFLARILKDL